MQLKPNDDPVNNNFNPDNTGYNSGSGGNSYYTQAEEYPAPVQQIPTYGAPEEKDSIYRPNTADYAKQKKGINPLFIIIPIVVVIGLIVYSGYKRFFGQSKYIPGTLNETTYSNEYFGVKADFKGWDVTGYEGRDEQSELDTLKFVNELSAENNMSGSGVYVIVQKTAINYAELGRMKDLLAMNEEKVKSELEQSGYSNISIKEDTFNIAEKAVDGFVVEGDYSAGGKTIRVCVVDAYIVKGNYWMEISCGANSVGKATQILRNFKAY